MSTLATAEGTARYAKAHEADASHWRKVHGLTVSSIGFGSYLGESTDEADHAYTEAFSWGIANGTNVLDTASNYRLGRSERAVGEAIRASGAARDGLVVVTKGGFMRDPETFERDYVRTGIVSPGDIARGCHVMNGRFLGYELEMSREALGLDSIDVYLLHNPETQLTGGLPRLVFDKRMRDTFAVLEDARSDGLIGMYGLATWMAMRVPPGNPQHVSLQRALDLAREVGGPDHGLCALELPHNIGMPEAGIAPTQEWEGELVPALEAASRAGLLTLGSATLLQTRLLGRISPELRGDLGAEDDVAASIQFSRSTPGMTTALVGTGRIEHAQENLAARHLPARPEAVAKLLRG